MYEMKKMMVALDMTHMDEVLVSYADFIEESLKPEIIYFVHVREDRDKNGPKNPLEISDEVIQDRMQKLMEGHFSDKTKVDAQVIQLKGSLLKELLHFAKAEKIDLLIVGSKYEERGWGTGFIPQKLARKAPCSILFVPEEPRNKLNKVLLPTDFSSYSKMAFDEVRFFKEEMKEVKILAQHVYKVPTGFYSSGKSYEEFAEIMEKNSREQFEEYIQQIGVKDLGIEPHFTLIEDHPYEAIIELAKDQNVDMIIIGAKGHSATSALLLGSTTERIVDNMPPIPILILKKKGETLGLLATIFNI